MFGMKNLRKVLKHIISILFGYAPYEDPEIAFAIVAPNVYNDGGARLPYNISARIGERVVEAYYETKEEKQDQLNNETEQEDTQAEAE